MNANAPITQLVTEMDRYLFDLNGYLILKNALSADEVDAMNQTYDDVQKFSETMDSQMGWFGNVRINNSGRQEGLGMQQLYEAGPVWEELIDHPSWFEKIKHFVGTDDPENFDGHHGPAFIDECFGTIRGPGGAQRLHSGGHVGTIRTQFRYHAGKFHCGQVNVLMALTDIGPGDGATMVVPGSHKAQHAPATEDLSRTDLFPGAVEICGTPGTAILFHNALWHSQGPWNKNDGARIMLYYAYEHPWMIASQEHWGYSKAFYNGLSTERRGLFHGFLFDLLIVIQMCKRTNSREDDNK